MYHFVLFYPTLPWVQCWSKQWVRVCAQKSIPICAPANKNWKDNMRSWMSLRTNIGIPLPHRCSVDVESVIVVVVYVRLDARTNLSHFSVRTLFLSAVLVKKYVFRIQRTRYNRSTTGQVHIRESCVCVNQVHLQNSHLALNLHTIPSTLYSRKSIKCHRNQTGGLTERGSLPFD